MLPRHERASRAATAAIAARQRLLQLPARRLPTRATAPCRRPWSALTASFQRSATRSVGGSTAQSRYPERSATRSVGGSTAQSRKTAQRHPQRGWPVREASPCKRRAASRHGKQAKRCSELTVTIRSHRSHIVPPLPLTHAVEPGYRIVTNKFLPLRRSRTGPNLFVPRCRLGVNVNRRHLRRTLTLPQRCAQRLPIERPK